MKLVGEENVTAAGSVSFNGPTPLGSNGDSSQKARGNWMKTFSSLPKETESIAFDRRGVRGSRASLLRLSHPSGVVTTTSSNRCSSPSVVLTITPGILASVLCRIESIFFPSRIVASALAGSAILAIMF